MPFIEQMLYGVNIKAEKPNNSVLAASSGMGDDATAEIIRLCDSWGTPPPLGLEHPALMSFPLTSSLRSIPGHLYAVIRAGRGLNPLFHAVVLSEGSYATFMRNPFAVAQAVDFLDEWNPDRKLARAEIACDPGLPLVDPPSGPSDIGLVDEAVLKIIAEDKLAMPIEQTNSQSDRCLALIIACLPEKMRKDLRFASFSPSGANNYTLAGIESEGCVFAGWQRMMMAWLAGDTPPGVESYIEEIRKYLAAGDLAGIARTTQRHRLPSGPGPDKADPSRRGTVSASMRGELAPAAPPPRPMKLEPVAPVKPTAPPAMSRPSVTAPAPSRPKPRKSSPLKRNNPNPTSTSPRRRKPRATFTRVAFGIVILAAAAIAGGMWKEGKTLAESLEWANLQGLTGEQIRTERAATLLEVVDVGSVYARQLKLVSESGKGLNPSVDKGRNKALGNLRDLAAEPLVQQVELFAKLATDGIQQASRPDRESQRMRSLAGQGLVLENELARLELAWYSLASGVHWQDVSTLPDRAVMARRDSLAGAEKGVLLDARRDLGTTEAMEVLDRTRGHVSGMASLLTLFDAPSYSREWEGKLSRAAAQVAPTASKMTRAYANSAFALVRLKKAERKAAQTSLPYRRDLTDQDWPSGEIRSILTNLRAQTVMFPRGRTPEILTGTLDLYSALKNPAALAAEVAKSPRVMSELEANAAVRFHPQAYGDFLERIRFEAAVLDLAGASDPESIPEALFGREDRSQVVAFRSTLAHRPAAAVWDSLAAAPGRPFLKRWAARLAAAVQVDLARAGEAFDADWTECRRTAERLQDEVIAGRDWTRSWLEMDKLTREVLTEYTGPLAADPVRSGKLADITNFRVALKAVLPLVLRSGTIRLDQDRLTEAAKARLEIRVVPDGAGIRSDKFHIGPAAPAGTGWVGTVSLDESLKIHPDQGLEIKVVSEDGGETLLKVECPSLADGTGPGAMLRPRSGGRGAVSLKVDPEYWKSLRVPALGMIF